MSVLSVQGYVAEAISVQRFLSLSVAEQEQVLSGRGSHDAVIGTNGKGVDRAEVLRILEAVGQLH